MAGLKRVAKKAVGGMVFNQGGAINWFPNHMVNATRAIRARLKLADLVIEVRDSRIPLSSANQDLQPLLSNKRRVIALNKKDLANPNIMPKWIHYFESCQQDCLSICAHQRSSVTQLLELVHFKLKEVLSREPTLLVMVVGVPNIGKSVLINSIHQIASARFPVQNKMKRAKVGRLPGVTQDIAGFKIAHRPSVYVLDTPGVLVPSIPDIETGLKLALTGSVKDSVVGEDRIAKYVLEVMNLRSTPLRWRHLNNRRIERFRNELEKKFDLKDLLPRKMKLRDSSSVQYVENIATEVQCALFATLQDFDGKLEDDMEILIEEQFEALRKVMKIPHEGSEGRLMVSKKFLMLFRSGKLGPFIFDDVPEAACPSS